MNKISSAPIRIKLLDTTIYQQDQTGYPQIMIHPSPSHYPQLIDSSQKELLCTSDTEAPVSTSCFFDVFCCCR